MVPEDAPLPPTQAVLESDREADWPDRLRTLAEQARIPVLADYYRGQLIRANPEERVGSRNTWTPAEALDAYADREGYLWWARGKTLLLRKRDWYFQRLYEVPDRWMASMVARLEARHGGLSYADVAQLLDLTPAQMEGLGRLQPAHAHEEYEMPPQRALLALIAASPKAADLPVLDSTAVSPEVRDRLSLTAPMFTPSQRALLVALAEAQDRPISPQGIEGFRVDMQRVSDRPRAARGYRCVSIVVHCYFAEEKFSLYLVYLPASLPDDRRAKTRIDLP